MARLNKLKTTCPRKTKNSWSPWTQSEVSKGKRTTCDGRLISSKRQLESIDYIVYVDNSVYSALRIL